MPELREVTGIVFKSQKFKEADRLVKILTKQMGIITVLARGVLKPKSKLAPAVFNFAHGTYEISTTGQGISTLRTYKAVRQYEELFADLTKSAYASYMLDLAAHAFEEYEPLGKFYDLIVGAVALLASGTDPLILTELVELQMLEAYGVMPNLANCSLCGETHGIFDYSLSIGGVICSRHFSQVTRMHLAPKETALIRTLGLIDLGRLGKINLSEQLKINVYHAIDRIYLSTLDLNLKSKKFLDELALI